MIGDHAANRPGGPPAAFGCVGAGQIQMQVPTYVPKKKLFSYQPGYLNKILVTIGSLKTCT